jgi:recA bacterial DNA recombination protein
MRFPGLDPGDEFRMSTPIAFAPPPGPDPVAGAPLTSFPSGRLSEIVGPRSSGGSSLLMAVLARATAGGSLAAMVDVADCLDPASAREARVDLQRLLWVRCAGRLGAALRAADLLVRCPGFAMVGLDLGPGPGPRIPHAALVRLQRGAESGGAVLILRALHHVAGSAASLVLSIAATRVCWIGIPRPTSLAGLVSDVRVAHARGPGRQGFGVRGSSAQGPDGQGHDVQGRGRAGAGGAAWSIGFSAREWPPASPEARSGSRVA